MEYLNLQNGMTVMYSRDIQTNIETTIPRVLDYSASHICEDSQDRRRWTSFN